MEGLGNISELGVPVVRFNIVSRTEDNVNDSTLIDWIYENEICGTSGKDYDLEEIIIDKAVGLRGRNLGTCIPGGSYGYNAAYIPKDSKIYILRSTGADFIGSTKSINMCVEELNNLFDQILSTFKFID